MPHLIILLFIEQLRLACRLIIILLIIEQLRLPCHTDFEDPFLGPPTHSCENILLAFELYEIEISVAASLPSFHL
jgi:hypothetical protein